MFKYLKEDKMNSTSNTMERPRTGTAGGDWRNEPMVCPVANIFENQNEYLLELEMPGVKKEGLEISVEGNELSIKGRTERATPPGEPIYCESLGADFCRSFELNNDVDTSKIRAELNQGVLCLHLPKAEGVKPRKIQIEG
jgi:HSP20 family protein